MIGGYLHIFPFLWFSREKLVGKMASLSYERENCSRHNLKYVNDEWLCVAASRNIQLLNMPFITPVIITSFMKHVLVSNTLLSITILLFQPRVNALIFLPILGWKYSCEYPTCRLKEYKVYCAATMSDYLSYIITDGDDVIFDPDCKQ